MALIARGARDQYGLSRGPRAFGFAAAWAAVLTVASIGAGIAYFGDATAWQEWTATVRGIEDGGRALTIEQGNQSIPMWLSRAIRRFPQRWDMD